MCTKLHLSRTAVSSSPLENRKPASPETEITLLCEFPLVLDGFEGGRRRGQRLRSRREQPRLGCLAILNLCAPAGSAAGRERVHATSRMLGRSFLPGHRSHPAGCARPV